MSDSGNIVPLNIKFLVTTQPRYELDAASEVWHCLYANGYGEDIEVYFVRRKDRAIAGLIAIVFDGNPIEAIQKIRAYLLEKPWILRYTNKIIPVELATKSIDELLNFIAEKAKLRIGPNDTWKIQVSKRASKISSRRLIERVASVINVGKVSLEDPQWIVNIEVIRDVYLIALIRPEWIIRKKEIASVLQKKKPLEYL